LLKIAILTDLIPDSIRDFVEKLELKFDNFYLPVKLLKNHRLNLKRAQFWL